MALGTVVLNKSLSSTWGNKKMRVATVQLTSGANYTTGGETLNATQVGLRKIEQVNVLGLALTASGSTSRSVGYIGTGSSTKILTQTTASAEAAASSDQSTFFAQIQFIGI